MGLSKKVENSIFQIIKFCFHESTFKAYSAHCMCAIDMVDSALKTLGLAVVKYNKSFKKHHGKIFSEPGKQGPVYWSLVDLKKKIADFIYINLASCLM